MLILEQYGVRLVRVQEKDIELIRNWRNQEHVASFMEYRNHITPDAQKEWFRSINNKYNYYFIIEVDNKQVGLINSKNYDPAVGFGEGGIFISDKESVHSFAAVFASLCLLNFMFLKLNVSSVSRIKVLKTNERAIQYNKLLGYKLLPGQENVENQLYELNINDYKTIGGKLNRTATLLCGGNSELKFSGEISELNMDAINVLLSNL
jgi:UDP-4-amino-4,6-dideoxy-N-acetyl-beta-L-altrosamine N-acetyltransferase